MKMAYEKPMLINLDGSDVSIGNCNPGPVDQGSCKTGGDARPGMCSTGNFAKSNCNVGNTVYLNNCNIGDVVWINSPILLFG